MAEHFRFFDSANPNEPDRTYNAQEFTDYFKALVTTGVMKGTGNQLKVTTTGANMVSSIDTGTAFLLGRYYENDSLLALLHETESVGRDRIDRIVIRMDLSTEARNVKAFIKKGVPGTVPVAPPLIQTVELYEISVAQVLIKGGQTFINTNAVTDERGIDIICPWAGSKILPNFNDEYIEGLVNDVSLLGTNKANKIQQPEIIATLSSGWAQPSANKLRYYKDDFGIVRVVGEVVKGSGATFSIATLPIGYRPKESFYTVATDGGFTISGAAMNKEGLLSVLDFAKFTYGCGFSFSFRT